MKVWTRLGWGIAAPGATWVLFKYAIMTKRKSLTYRHVASAAVAAAVAVAVHIIVLGVGLSETMRAGLVLPRTHLAARHPASFRPSWVPPG